MSSGPVPRLPDDAILVHIGMHKTGTTAIQSMLAAARRDLRAQGIRYPGRGDAHHPMAQSLIGSSSQFGKSDVPQRQRWTTVAQAAANHTGCTVLSSEFLSRAGPAEVRKFVAALGPERVYVIVGVRSFGPVLLSAWQQTLKTGNVHSLDEWIAQNFVAGADGRVTGEYWREQHPVPAVRRWADIVGPDRVFVVVTDDADHTLLPSAFEGLLGLAPGTLSARNVGKSNRSMTAAETMLVRAVNGTVRGKVNGAEYRRLVRYGMLRRLVESRPRAADEAMSLLSPEAIELAAREGEVSARELAQTGTHIIGDLNNLVVQPSGVSGANTELPLTAAAEAVVGVVAAALRGSWKLTAPPPVEQQAPEPRSLDQVGTHELVRLLGRRLTAPLKRRGGPR